MKMLSKVCVWFVGFTMICHIVLRGSSTIAAQEAGSPTDSAQRGQEMPTGKAITPTAARGSFLQDLNPERSSAPDVRADGPASISVSPDGKWLAILASGYNEFSGRDGNSPPELSTDYLFLFDIKEPRPKQIQVFPIHASFQGLAWTPSSDRLFASGGVDDTVVEFVREGAKFIAGRTFAMGHKAWVGPDIKLFTKPDGKNCVGCTGEVSGLAVNRAGNRLLVANIMNDSVSMVDIASGKLMVEQDLRPGIIDPRDHGKAGGSYPCAIVWTSANHAYVASERDREIISLTVSERRMSVLARIPVNGQPVALLANRSGSRVYVALDTTNRLVILDTRRNKAIETLDAVAPESIYANTKTLGGANTNALALTPDERTLLVSNGGEDALAVVALSEAAQERFNKTRTTHRLHDDDEDHTLDRSKVVGLIPTGWYPSGIGISKDGSKWYVINGKSPTGPNVSWCSEMDQEGKLCVSHKVGKDPDYPSSQQDSGGIIFAENQHIEQLEKATLLTLPVPGPLELARLTKQVAHNNHYDQPDKTATDEKVFSFLRDHIKHVIYIMKENRSYDQVLGDLDVGNGDPRFTFFPEKISPNHHAIARNFVDLDNTLVSAEGSSQGWMWTYAAQTTDYHERNGPHMYSERGPEYEGYGSNRGINMGYATSGERHALLPSSPADPDILPGTHDVAAPDGPGGIEGKGYIWDVALAKGLTVRNYGLSRGNGLGELQHKELVRDPYAQKIQVVSMKKSSLAPYTDLYFYSLNVAYPDYWRVQEWKREFEQFAEQKSAPNLLVMWLGGDHFGSFAKAIDGVNTPETQMADNDYAVGLVIAAVAHSPFANDTLIFTIEDDAWDGADHVEAHRTVALVAGPYVRQHAVVSERYTTVSMVKTIEEILGFGPIGLNDALAAPMSDVFDPLQSTWTYKAIVPNVLRSTRLPLPTDEHAQIEHPTHSATYWARATRGQDFSGPDRVDPVSFARALWRGLKPNPPIQPQQTGLNH